MKYDCVMCFNVHKNNLIFDEIDMEFIVITH